MTVVLEILGVLIFCGLCWLVSDWLGLKWGPNSDSDDFDGPC